MEKYMRIMWDRERGEEIVWVKPERNASDGVK